MKKAVPILVMLSMAFLFFVVKASAVETAGEYRIREEGEHYILEEHGESYAEIGKFESVADCFLSMSDVSRVIFDNVSSDAALELPKGEYIIEGELYSDGVITVPKGADITFTDLSLGLNDGAYLRIKGGSVTVNSSDITGDGELIRLDYSSSASLVINSGVISGEYEGALIDIRNGSAMILGGDIENKSGASIKNDSELILSNSPSVKGAPYGIILESPMHLSDGESEYSSESKLAVQYLADFAEGTLTEIFYSASARSVKNIKLYDKDGKEAEITQFDSTNHVSEKNFAGVYLPYTVSFYIDDIQVHEEKLLSGEKLPECQPTVPAGYAFDSWYEDREGTAPYSFDKRVYSSFSLYGIYELMPPSFSISSMEFVYDGADHTLSFDGLTHQLEGGYYTYLWYRDGIEISTLSSLKIKNVSDSGSYSCFVTYVYNGKTAQVYAENIKINVKQKEISPPQISSAEYTGNPIYPSLAATSYYTVSITPGTDVGLYTQVLTLTDPENTKWQGSEDSALSLNFEITRAENLWLEPPQFYDSYIGFPLKNRAISKFGEVIYLYSATENGIYKTDAPTSVGTYFVKAQVVESSNFTGLVSEPVSFSILPEEVVGISLVSSPAQSEYFSFESLDPEGLVIKAIYNSSREEIIENHRLKVIYNNGNSFRMGDTGVTLEYMGATLILPVTVKLLSYNLDGLNFKDFSLVYDGAYHSFEDELPEISGKDGIPLKYEISGGGSEAGEYSVTLTFSTASPDYLTPESITVKMTILPREVELVWDNISFVYDGTSHVPSASFTDTLGVKRAVTVSGSKVLAGEDYIAEATPYSGNYVYKNPTCTYSIAKADYDMSGIFWSASDMTYTGDYLEVTLAGLPNGVSVVGYTDNRAINVGQYLATASLKYDSKNYNTPTLPTYSWSILPAQYDLSGFKFADSEYEYDGEMKYPTLCGTLPTGADGIPLEYTFSTGARNVSDGTVTVIITFTTASKNYFVPNPITANVKITPKGIYALWTSDSFVYDGKAHIPLAESPYAEIKVTGGSINAGSYTARAESLDPNYTVVNDTHSYEIKKSENLWLTSPSISEFYESQAPSPTATAYYGTPIFKYYRDESLTTEAETLTHGTYYMVATVPESQNYLTLTSSPIEVTVLEVLPVDIRVEILSDLVAFETLGEDDFVLYLIYNDGNETLIKENITINYENSDTLLCKDTAVEFIYSDFLKEVPVSVGKATYDLSGVKWDRTEAVYNGEPKSPTISGLPSGITLLGYSGDAGINAGTYTFTAIVAYDEENYEAPQIPGCTFTILKAAVPLIADKTTEYSGESVPLDETELYMPEVEYLIINSGEYRVTYKLKDPENYMFENGSDTLVTMVTVLPKSINITVSDFDLYLFESKIAPEYMIEGDIAECDDLGLYFYLDGDDIYLGSTNPNYILNVKCGKLNRIGYPSETVRRRIILILFVVIAIIIAICVIYKNREGILDAVYMARAKRKNKAYIGYIDNSGEDKSSPIVYKSPSESISELCGESNFENTDVSSENGEIKDISKEGVIAAPSFIEDIQALKIEELEDTEDLEKSELEAPEDLEESDPEVPEDVEESDSESPGDLEESELEKTEDMEETESEESYKEITQEKTDEVPPISEEPKIQIKMEDADAMLSDSMAKEMIKDERERIYTDGKSKSIINVDTLSRNFIADDRVDVNILKQKSLVPYDTAYIKVLARGAIDKPLHVYANDFSLSAVKMILLSGGEARRVTTVKVEKNKTKR